jgi:hypothetical protein
MKLPEYIWIIHTDFTVPALVRLRLTHPKDAGVDKEEGHYEPVGSSATSTQNWPRGSYVLEGDTGTLRYISAEDLGSGGNWNRRWEPRRRWWLEASTALRNFQTAMAEKRALMDRHVDSAFALVEEARSK